ncbi:MAG: HPP family protein [Gammaproteobacteria bacterium]|nr:HPP family protein [Gammaproteobacteria bacterium]
MSVEKFKHFIGFESSHVSHTEKLASAMGGFVGISLIALISYWFTGASGSTLIVPSMGASAVLVFAVPHGKLSQPWALFGGHLSSALIGVACYQFIPNLFLAAGLAVGLAIGAMHVLRCIHPPGGATALAAVIGGSAIHELGYSYALTPVLLNCIIIFIVALTFNSVFPWRRYPVTLMRFTDTPKTLQNKTILPFKQHHLEKAIEDMDLVIDATIDDLQSLFTLCLKEAQHARLKPADIKLGHYYSNGLHGTEWCVRHIIDESHHTDPDKDMVIYRIAEGIGLRSADSCSRTEFAHWADHEVFATKK